MNIVLKKMIVMGFSGDFENIIHIQVKIIFMLQKKKKKKRKEKKRKEKLDFSIIVFISHKIFIKRK